MLEAFIITLREGVEAALIVGITLVYLAKIGRNDLRKAVYAALAAAFLGSIAVAVVISRTHWNEDVFEGWIMLAAAFFVVTMVVFMMRTGRKLKGEIEGKVGTLAGENAWFGLFIFVFLMVLREGAETVLVLSAVSLNSTELMSFLGTLFGIIAAIAFGVMFVKGSVRINLQKFFRVTTAILFLVAARAVFLRDHLRPRRPHGVIRCQAPPAIAPSQLSRRIPEGRLDGSPRASLDGIGLYLLLRLYRPGHGGIYLHQERERAFTGHSGRVR